MWRFTLNNSNAATSCVGHIPSRAICKHKATFHFASSVDDQMYLWSGQWDTLKYACCTETKAKGISTSSYFLYKVTVSMATGWWLVFPPYFLSIFSLFSLHICNISVWRPLVTIVGLTPSTQLLFFTFQFYLPLSLSLLLWKTKWKSGA